MNDDELLARLRAADPARHIDPASSWTDDLAEAVMDTESKQEAPRRGSTAPARGRWLVAAAAVVAIAGGGAIAATLVGEERREDVPPTEMALSLAPQDAMQMCMQFSVEGLRPMEVAFSGTVDDIVGDTVTITPDRWYKGGEAQVVTLEAPSEAVLLEGGTTFAEGERYLVTATGGTVSSCGFSGPWTAELAAAYGEAF